MNQFYRVSFEQSEGCEGGIIKTIDVVSEIKSTNVFLRFDTASFGFKNWWSWRRRKDGAISFKAMSATAEESLGKIGLTGVPANFQHELVQVELQDGVLIVVEPKLPHYYSGFSWYEGDWDENLFLAEQANKSVNSDTAIELLGLMQHLSEEYYSAPYWALGLEFALWSDIHEDRHQHLKDLHQKCQGWWVWNDAEDNLSFAGVEQWLLW